MRINLTWRGLVPGAEPLEAQKVEKHPEVEEVAEATEMTSEDAHGGEEATGQVEDSPPMEAPGEETTPGTPGTSGDEGAPEASDESASAGEGSGSGESSSASGSEEAEETAGASGEGGAQGSGESPADGEAAQGKGEEETDAEEGAEGEGSTDEDGEATGEAEGKAASGPTNGDAQGKLEDTSEEDETEPEELAQGELEPDEGEAEEPGERNAYSWEFNPEAALRSLQLAFARLVEAVAEDRAHPDPYGDEEWNPEALMLREWTGRPLAACRRGWHRESLVLVLDSSGSCEAQAEFYSRLASLAARAGTVELWNAPNGQLTKRYRKGHWEPVERERGPWPWKGRTILFFGDFDGGDYPIEASWRNEVLWFSPESRYEDTLEHDWCHLPLRSFRGKYFPVRDEREFIEAIRRLR